MKFRTWLNLITIVLLVLIIYFGWAEIVKAWEIMGSANLWILSLIVPVQVFSYYAVGEVIFSYLRSKGNLKTVSRWEMSRMALELNFVNHILPSGGVAGFSYMDWLLSRHGVGPGRATMSQIVRYTLYFVSFVGLILLSLVFLFIDQKMNKTIAVITMLLVLAVIALLIAMFYAMNSRKRLSSFAVWLVKVTNGFVRFVSFGKKTEVLKLNAVEEFFGEIHQDYLEILDEKKILIKPLIWTILGQILDVALLVIAFLALGQWVNPAMLFVAFALSSIVSAFSGTLGGTGVYEAVMVSFLAAAGVSADVAIAGTLLARVILLVGTILFGYFFYQLTLNKYGKSDK